MGGNVTHMLFFVLLLFRTVGRRSGLKVELAVILDEGAWVRKK